MIADDNTFNFEDINLARIFRELEEEVLEATGGRSRDIVTYFGVSRHALLSSLSSHRDGKGDEGLAEREAGTESDEGYVATDVEDFPWCLSSSPE